jgi:hypothetical protein
MNEALKIPQVDLRSLVPGWVALHPKTCAVIANSASIKEARDMAKRIGVARPLLMAVPKSKGFFVGLGTPIDVAGR